MRYYAMQRDYKHITIKSGVNQTTHRKPPAGVLVGYLLVTAAPASNEPIGLI